MSMDMALPSPPRPLGLFYDDITLPFPSIFKVDAGELSPQPDTPDTPHEVTTRGSWSKAWKTQLGPFFFLLPCLPPYQISKFALTLACLTKACPFSFLFKLSCAHATHTAPIGTLTQIK